MIKLEADKLKLWSMICTISAVPSFYWAMAVGKNNMSAILAMLDGIVLFILVYTVIASSEFYKKMKQKIFWFSALKWAFRVRVFYSMIVFPFILAIEVTRSVFMLTDPKAGDSVGVVLIFINFVDVWLGAASTEIMMFFLSKAASRNEFFSTFFLTITQGILLSLAVLAVAVIIWCFFRLKHIVFSNK